MIMITLKCLLLNWKQNSLIEQTSISITQSVNAQFEDVNGELQDVGASLELKLNTDDLTTEINARADEINLSGYVKMSNLENEGETTINGSNITTGIIKSTNGNLKIILDTGIFESDKKIIIYNPSGTLYNQKTEIQGALIDTYELSCFKFENFSDLDGEIAATIYQGKVTCRSLTQTSEAEKKKNFEKYNGALQEIKKIDIYKYNLISEDDDKKKHIGL